MSLISQCAQYFKVMHWSSITAKSWPLALCNCLSSWTWLPFEFPFRPMNRSSVKNEPRRCHCVQVHLCGGGTCGHILILPVGKERCSCGLFGCLSWDRRKQFVHKSLTFAFFFCYIYACDCFPMCMHFLSPSLGYKVQLHVPTCLEGFQWT